MADRDTVIRVPEAMGGGELHVALTDDGRITFSATSLHRLLAIEPDDEILTWMQEHPGRHPGVTEDELEKYVARSPRPDAWEVHRMIREAILPLFRQGGGGGRLN